MKKIKFFEYSRDPLEFLNRGSQFTKWDPWFEKNGYRMLNTFLKELKFARIVSHANLSPIDSHFDQKSGLHISRTSFHIHFKGYHAIQATGLGAADSPDLAKTIAVAELLERLSCFVHVSAYINDQKNPLPLAPRLARVTSNGAAFHCSPVLALKGALFELFERDSLLANWYSNKQIPVSHPESDPKLGKLCLEFQKIGWNLREHHWSYDPVGAHAVWVSLVRTKRRENTWNFFLGGGSGLSHKEAFNKAFKEVSRAFYMWPNGTIPDTSEKIKEKDLTDDPASRIFYYQKPANIERFLSRIGKPSKRPDIRDGKKMKERDFIERCFSHYATLRIIPLPVPFSMRDHIFVVQGICDELQNLDWKIPPEYNYGRIKSGFGTQARGLCKVPHPIP